MKLGIALIPRVEFRCLIIYKKYLEKERNDVKIFHFISTSCYKPRNSLLFIINAHINSINSRAFNTKIFHILKYRNSKSYIELNRLMTPGIITYINI